MVSDKPARNLKETAIPAEKIIDIVSRLALH
jgi:hypothetical protein